MTSWAEHVEAGRNEQPVVFDLAAIAAYNRQRDQRMRDLHAAVRDGASVVMPGGRTGRISNMRVVDGEQIFNIDLMPDLWDGDQA